MSHLEDYKLTYEDELEDAVPEPFFGGYTFGEVLGRSVELLRQELCGGHVYDATLQTFDELGGGDNQMRQDMDGILRDGNTMYSTDERLRIDRYSPANKFVAMEAATGRPEIGINLDFFTKLASEHSDVFTEDRMGRDRMAWEIAATLGYGVMVNHAKPGVSSLPTMVEDAVIQLSAKCFDGCNYNRCRAGQRSTRSIGGHVAGNSPQQETLVPSEKEAVPVIVRATPAEQPEQKSMRPDGQNET